MLQVLLSTPQLDYISVYLGDMSRLWRHFEVILSHKATHCSSAMIGATRPFMVLLIGRAPITAAYAFTWSFKNLTMIAVVALSS
mmetsp:Transcript_56364/g.93189  ORF Transcript_56364/g.93189 Transcript_56364/m.93189 type:complete len:84 (+) Transcript_56364:57-308(+)